MHGESNFARKRFWPIHISLQMYDVKTVLHGFKSMI